jgi:hypothetical protein
MKFAKKKKKRLLINKLLIFSILVRLYNRFIACKNEVWRIFLQLTILVSKYLVINFNNFTVFNAHEIKDDSQNKERLNPSLEKEACSLIYQYIIYTY